MIAIFHFLSYLTFNGIQNSQPYFLFLQTWLQWHHIHCFTANSESPGESLSYPSIKCLKA